MRKKLLTPDQAAVMAGVAHVLSQNPRDRKSLSFAVQEIASGNGRFLFEALLDRQRAYGGDQGAEIVSTMSLLDRMMGMSPGVAGYLMARLHPIVGNTHLHDVYDNIEWWITTSTSDDLADSLMLLASEGFGPRKRKLYEAWAVNIRENIRRAKRQAEEDNPYYRSPPVPPVDRLDFVEDVTSEERVRAHVLALARGQRSDLASRFIFHQHVYEAEAATDEHAIVKAYLTFLGYHPEAREQPSSASRTEHLSELDVQVAYALLAEAFHRHFPGAEKPATEAEPQTVVQRVREATEAWAILAFTNLEIPPEHKTDLLSNPFHRIVTDVGDEAGVILLGEQDIAMIWFVDGAPPDRRD